MAATRHTRRLSECCQQDGLQADDTEPVLKNVKVVGYESANDRRYTDAALRDALSLYACKVNCDHPEGSAGESRSIRDRFGKLENQRLVAEDGVRADLRYNPHHPLAPMVKWFAENCPDAIGLSHNAVGQGETDENGIFVVDKIVAVRSVDLVADPATTKGLFESINMADDLYGDDDLDAGPGAASAGGDDSGHWSDHVSTMVGKIVSDPDMSKAEKRKKVLAALNLLDDPSDAGTGDGEDEEEEDDEDQPAIDPEDEEGLDPDALPDDASGDSPPLSSSSGKSKNTGRGTARESRKGKKARPSAREQELAEKLDRYESAERLRSARKQARKLCVESGLPKQLVTAVFIEQLAAAPSDAYRKALIEDRRRLAGRKPTSFGPSRAGKLTEDRVLEALTSGDEE